MGTDFNLKIEIINKDGNWEEFVIDDRLIPNERDFNVFHYPFLKNDVMHPLFFERILPKDSCFYHEFNKGYFCKTYFTLSESRFISWPERLSHCYFRIFVDHILPRIVSYRDVVNVRVVVAFSCYHLF